MLLEEAAEFFPDDMDEDTIEDLLDEPCLDDDSREALLVIRENF